MKLSFLKPCKSIVLSVLVHLGFASILIFNFQVTRKIQPLGQAEQEPMKIVKAIAIDEQAVRAEIKRLEQKENKKTRLDSQRKTDLSKQQVALKKIKQQTEVLKKEASVQVKALKIEQKKMEKAKKLAALEKKKIEQLKKQAKQAQVEMNQLKARLNKEKQKLVKERLRLAEKRKREAKAKAMRKANLLDEEVSIFLAQIKDKIEEGRQFLLHLSSNLSTELSFFLLPDGSIKDLKVIKKSGNVIYDENALMTVRKAAPFEEMPKALEVLQRLNRVITLKVKNEHSI